jgi:hypothetical protein
MAININIPIEDAVTDGSLNPITSNAVFDAISGLKATASTLQHAVKAGEIMTKGQAVYVSSADGTNMIVSLASNVTEATSSKTMGLIIQDLALNGKGTVITEGLLAGLNTSSATAGDPVWLDTNGNLKYGLINKPAAPAHLVFIGIVTRANVNKGEIFVRVQNGFELQELHNVSITSVADNNLLQYDSATSLWKNESFLTAGIYTPRVQSVTSSATVTPTSTNDLVKITAQAVGLTLANPTGTFDEGKDLIIRIKDNGTARSIAYGTKYRAIGVTLPTTTVIGKTTYLGIIYNLTDDTYDVVGVTTQA